MEDLSIDDSAPKKSRVREPEQMEEYVNSQGVRFIPLQQRAPYGALCVRELFRFLISMCSPLKKQSKEIISLGLGLLQVALEIAADAITNFPSLLALVKDDLCRNLILVSELCNLYSSSIYFKTKNIKTCFLMFQLLTVTGTDRESLMTFAVNLQVLFLLFESQREHLKFQLEHYLTKLIEIVTSESNKMLYEQRELALGKRSLQRHVMRTQILHSTKIIIFLNLQRL